MMKVRSSVGRGIRWAFAASTIYLLSLSPAFAVNKWWDINGATAGAGGATPGGAITGSFWTTDSAAGSIATGTLAAGDVAFFSAAADATGAFTVSGNATMAGLNVEEGTVSISGNLTLGANAMSIASGATLSVPTSTGTLGILTTAGSTLTINGGTLRNTNAGSAGTFFDVDTNIILGTGGGTLSYTTANSLSILQTGSVVSGSSLTKAGAGVLAIGVTPATYTGSTTVAAGELRNRTTNNGMPTTTDVTVNSGAVWNLNGVSQSVRTITGSGDIGTGAGTLTLTGAASTTFSGALKNIANAGAGAVVSGNGRLVKQGAGTVTFQGLNDINGSVTLTAGGITVDASGSLCGDIADLAVNGGTLTLNQAAETVENLTGTGGTINLNNAALSLIVDPVGTSSNASTITGAGGITKVNVNSGATVRTQTLTGNNSYTGNTFVKGGILSVGHANALGTTAGYTEVNQVGSVAAELLFTGATTNFTINEPLRIAGAGATDSGAIAVIAGATPTISGAVTLIGNSTVTVSSTSAVTFSNANSFTSAANESLTLQGGSGAGAGGLISGVVNLGAGSLTKAQGGKWVLEGSNIYTGGTTISAGTLLANNTTGSATGSGPVTVNGGTLGGTGAVSGAVTVNDGGTLSPGASVESLGTGSLTFNATASAGSTLKFEIGPPATADLVNAALGSLSIANPATTFGATLSLASAGFPGAVPDGTKYTVIAYNGTWDGNSFKNAPNLGIILFGAQQFKVRYADTIPGGNFASETSSITNPNITSGSRFVTLTAVPELGSFITMGLVGCCAVFAVRLGKRYGFKALSL